MNNGIPTDKPVIAGTTDGLIFASGKALRSISWHSDGRIIAKSSAGALHPRRLYTGRTIEEALTKLISDNYPYEPKPDTGESQLGGEGR